MAHEGGCEVLRNTSAFALRDEPLPGGVEHRASQWRMLDPQLGIGLDHPVENGNAKVSHGSGVIISLRAT